MQLAEVHSKNLNEMLFAIGDCLKAERQIPALVLMYSFIDSLSWVASGQSTADVRGRFEGWISRWLLPNLPSSNHQVTATDLYAARCAILHSGTGVSDLSKSKRAKRILYAWGDASTEALEHTIAAQGMAHEHAALHCKALFAAIRKGLEDFVASADQDPQLAKRLQTASIVQYTYVPM